MWRWKLVVQIWNSIGKTKNLKMIKFEWIILKQLNSGWVCGHLTNRWMDELEFNLITGSFLSSLWARFCLESDSNRHLINILIRILEILSNCRNEIDYILSELYQKVNFYFFKSKLIEFDRLFWYKSTF